MATRVTLAGLAFDEQFFKLMLVILHLNFQILYPQETSRGNATIDTWQYTRRQATCHTCMQLKSMTRVNGESVKYLLLGHRLLLTTVTLTLLMTRLVLEDGAGI